MSTDDLIDLLARAVADGWITEEEAEALLLEAIDEQERGNNRWALILPLPLRNGIVGFDESLMEAAAGMALVALGIRSLKSVPSPTAAILRTGYANRLQDLFDQRVRILANQVGTGAISVTRWQEEMLREIQLHIQQQTMVASGRSTLTLRQMERIDDLMTEQSAFLTRFADQLALRLGQNNPMSEAYVGRRSAMYGGVGRGMFYEESDAALVEGLGQGWVVEYIAVGDGATCEPCREAARVKYYLPGTGPMPGIDCLGRDRCRCYRIYRLLPEVYVELIAGRQALPRITRRAALRAPRQRRKRA